MPSLARVRARRRALSGHSHHEKPSAYLSGLANEITHQLEDDEYTNAQHENDTDNNNIDG